MCWSRIKQTSSSHRNVTCSTHDMPFWSHTYSEASLNQNGLWYILYNHFHVWYVARKLRWPRITCQKHKTNTILLLTQKENEVYFQKVLLLSSFNPYMHLLMAWLFFNKKYTKINDNMYMFRNLLAVWEQVLYIVLKQETICPTTIHISLSSQQVFISNKFMYKLLRH